MNKEKIKSAIEKTIRYMNGKLDKVVVTCSLCHSVVVLAFNIVLLPRYTYTCVATLVFIQNEKV